VPEEGEGEQDSEQPKRRKVDQVPLGIRKPKSPQFNASDFSELQKMEDEGREKAQLKEAEDGSLDSPELHQDYEIQDGEEFDRHLEGITTVNALKEFIAQAKEEVEDELGATPKDFSPGRIDELMVYTKEAVEGYGEETGYAKLKRHVRELIEADAQFAKEELDRKKDAYLRSAGK
jgi:hypothetical protein